MNNDTTQVQNSKIDLDIYVDDYNRRYTNNNLTTGLFRFVEFRETDGVLLYDEDGNPISSGLPLNPGIFKKSNSKWDIQAACNWLHTHSNSSSQHVCAKYVRMAIEAGGLSTAGRPNWAWKYIDYLPTIGFRFLKKVSKTDNFSPEPGDIAVYMKGDNPDVPGHICMWTGAEWASDFKQRSMIVYKSTPEAYVFRFEA